MPYLLACLLFFSHSLFSQGLILSEIYANGLGSSDKGQEWFELYNASSEDIVLNDVIFRRLDGVAQEEAFRLSVNSNEKLVIKAGEYFVIAQSYDLGLNRCLSIPMAVVRDSAFVLDNKGIQTLCVKAVNGEEDCAQFSNTQSFPEGHSRYFSGDTLAGNDRLAAWSVESCGLFGGAHATPGRAGQSCLADQNFYDEKTMHCPWSLGVFSDNPNIKFPKVFSILLDDTPHLRLEKNILGDAVFLVEHKSFEQKQALSVDFFYHQSATTAQGTLGDFIRDLSQANKFLWNTANLETGAYYVFARIADAAGGVTFTNSIGPFDVKKSEASEPLILKSARYDSSAQTISIRWEQNNTQGRLALFAADKDGVRRLIGLSVTAIEGENNLLWYSPLWAAKSKKIIAEFFSKDGKFETSINIENISQL